MDYKKQPYEDQARYIVGILRNRTQQQGGEVPIPKESAHMWGEIMLLLNAGVAGSLLGKLASESNDYNDFEQAINEIKMYDKKLSEFKKWQESRGE